MVKVGNKEWTTTWNSLLIFKRMLKIFKFDLVVFVSFYKPFSFKRLDLNDSREQSELAMLEFWNIMLWLTEPRQAEKLVKISKKSNISCKMKKKGFYNTILVMIRYYFVVIIIIINSQSQRDFWTWNHWGNSVSLNRLRYSMLY